MFEFVFSRPTIDIVRLDDSLGDKHLACSLSIELS